MNTNERFDEQFLMKGSDCTWENPPEPDEIKTFISQEKNLLLDQAIEVIGLEMGKLLLDSSFQLGANENTVIKFTLISKLQELKTNQ